MRHGHYLWLTVSHELRTPLNAILGWAGILSEGILDPAKTQVDFNSRWLATLSSVDWVKLASRYNLAQMLERREFRQRYDAGQPIALHEFLYPLSQGYDSVFLKADVELGGTDQLFNLNVGRDIMPSYGLPAQIIMTTPLLVGLDGVDRGGLVRSTGSSRQWPVQRADDARCDGAVEAQRGTHRRDLLADAKVG